MNFAVVVDGYCFQRVTVPGLVFPYMIFTR